MQQNQRLAVTLFDVMKPEGPHINELPKGRVVALCPFRNEAVDKPCYDESCGDDRTASSETMQRVRGGCKRTVRNPVAQLVWRHQLKILCVECPLEADPSEPMLHCNGNKLAGPSFPNRSLPIASSMIAMNSRKPKGD